MNTHKKLDALDYKKCKVCNKEIPKHKPSGKFYTAKEYVKKVVCSSECYQAFRYKPLVGNNCNNCGRDIPIFTSSGKKKTYTIYAKQKFCSKACTPQSRRHGDSCTKNRIKSKPRLYVPHTIEDKFILGVTL